MRLRDTVRFWMWCAVGLHGHLPQCRASTMLAADRRGRGLVASWSCAPTCPAHARRQAQRVR